MAAPVVVDASVVVKWLFTEEGSDRAMALRRGWEQEGALVCAPDFLLAEVYNVAYKKVKAGHLNPEPLLQEASRHFNLDLNWLPTPPLLRRALEYSLQTQMTVYDALYVALAKMIEAPLYTADREMAEKAGRLGVLARTL